MKGEKICGLKKSTAENKVFDPNKINIYMRDEFEENDVSKEIYKLIEPSKSKIYLSSCENVCATKQCIEFKKKFDQNIIHCEIGKEYKKVLIYLCNGYSVKNNRLDKTICEKRQIDHSELNKVLQERYPIVFSS